MVRITALQPEELPGNAAIYKDSSRDVKLKRSFLTCQSVFKLCKYIRMAIDPTLSPDMYVFGNAPKALETVITTYANMLYGPPNEADLQRDISGQSDHLRGAINRFRRAAAQGMQFEMDRLAGERGARMHYTPR